MVLTTAGTSDNPWHDADSHCLGGVHHASSLRPGTVVKRSVPITQVMTGSYQPRCAVQVLPGTMRIA
jgi:hypothetical protein